MAPPLAGVKVLDLSRMGPGPYCTMLLADLGAEVIKIEQPGFGIIPVDVDEETWAAYYAIDRNKKSITLDFKKAEARRVFHRMAETADVVIEGFRPGVAARLELDYETARAINPRIVYCSITGYGQDGPYRDLPGHDVNYISIAGALSAMAIRDGRTAVPLNMLGDYAGGGLQAAFAIVTALFARDRTGTGQLIDIAMVDGVVSLLSWDTQMGRYASHRGRSLRLRLPNEGRRIRQPRLLRGQVLGEPVPRAGAGGPDSVPVRRRRR
jgi:crotonobetainyl-CoA:carnitine CoA-transferase CaiB-like acyl-CoA transferase